MSTTWRNLSKIPMTYPFAFGMTISTVKTSFSDLLVQKVVENKETIDWRRNLAFASFGCFYLGGVQYFIYVPFFGRIFPNAASFAAKSIKDKLKDGKGLTSLFGQVFIDQFVHHPLLYFPVFYGIKEIVVHEKPQLTRALQEYRKNMKEDLTALWKVWIPSTLVNFAFMPMWARIPWVAGTSLLWTCILSAMRGGDVSHGEDMMGGAVSGATMTLMKEGFGELFTSSVDLDPNMCHICVTASGPDKVGWVGQVARAVSDRGGNVTHSTMIRLGQDFTILMHVSVPPERLPHLISGLNNDEGLEALNLRTSSLSRRQTGKFVAPMMGLRIHCVGEDRPGMLAAVAEKISEKNLSVENMTTELRKSKSGRRDFVINCDCSSTSIVDKESLNELIFDFSVLKKELNMDILDVRVHVGK